MEFAHAGDNGLACLLVCVGLESRILFSKALKGIGHFFLTGLCLGLNGHFDNRIREDHTFQDDLMILVAQGVACRGILQTHSTGDLTGIDRFDLFAVIGVHQHDTADALPLLLRGIHHIVPGVQRSAVYAEERQFSDKRINHDLECQCGERFVIRGMAFHLLFRIVGINAVDRRDIQRAWHIVDHRVQQRLHAFVAVAGAAQHRVH